MKNVNIEKLIYDLTFARRNEVINALYQAGINVNKQIDNNQLYEVVMAELNKGNQKLFLPLGKVIDATFDLTPLLQDDNMNIEFSGADGKTSTWDWIKTNASTIGSIGGGLLGGIFGGGGSSSGTPSTTIQTPGSGGVDTNTLLLMQQQQQAAQQARDEQRRKEDAASRAATMWVVGGIAAFLIIGGIITAVIISSNKAKVAAAEAAKSAKSA